MTKPQLATSGGLTAPPKYRTPQPETVGMDADSWREAFGRRGIRRAAECLWPRKWFTDLPPRQAPNDDPTPTTDGSNPS